MRQDCRDLFERPHVLRRTVSGLDDPCFVRCQVKVKWFTTASGIDISIYFVHHVFTKYTWGSSSQKPAKLLNVSQPRPQLYTPVLRSTSHVPAVPIGLPAPIFFFSITRHTDHYHCVSMYEPRRIDLRTDTPRKQIIRLTVLLIFIPNSLCATRNENRVAYSVWIK